MAGKLGRFDIQGWDSWKGLTKDNHFGTLFKKAPQLASNAMVQLLATHYKPCLETFLNEFPTREFENDAEYYWEIIGSSRMNIPLVEARTIDGTTVTSVMTENVGKNTSPFYLVFAKDWFADGEVIVGNLNEVYQFRILGDAREEGTNYVYRVELMGGNSTGVPVERLLAGERFSKEFAPVERELSRKVGDVRFATPTSMRNEWTTIRKQYKLTGNAMEQKLCCGIPIIDEKGNQRIEMNWVHLADWQFEKEFSEEKNIAMMYGRSNRNANGEYMNIGKSGNVIKTGDGLLALMESNNTKYYNHFDLDMIENALYQISAAKLDFGQRVFVMRTGEQGAKLFHKAIDERVSGWTKFQLNGDSLGVVGKASSPLHQNALRAGYQFTEYLAPNGVVLRLEVSGLYDDPYRNKILLNGYPAMSSRFDIMYIGTKEEPNIFKCQIKGNFGEARSIQPGIRDPWTGRNNLDNATTDEDASTLHKMTTFGVCVLDPTRTVSLIPSILRG